MQHQIDGNIAALVTAAMGKGTERGDGKKGTGKGDGVASSSTTAPTRAP